MSMQKGQHSSLFDRLRGSNNLPSLPHVLVRIIEACNKKEADFRELAGIIETDPALTAKILQFINSPYLRLPNKVVGLEQALVLVGIDAVRNIALCASVHQMFSKDADPEAFDIKKFWRHSLTCALLARDLAQRVAYPNPDEAFLAGLLHDIGKLILWTEMPQEYEHIVKAAGGDTDQLLSAEARLGAPHNEVGAWVIAEWNLESMMSDAVLFHHEPLFRVVEAFLLVRLIYAANSLTHDRRGSRDVQAAVSLLGLPQKEIGDAASHAEGELKNIARNLEIVIAGKPQEAAAAAESDSEKQELLRQEIKGTAVLLGTLQSLIRATGEESLVKVLYQGLRILFGISRAVFCRYDPERDLLIFKDGVLANKLVPFHESRSLIVQAIETGSVLESFTPRNGQTPSMLDEQIARQLKSEGFVCFPLVAGRARVGAVVVGVDKAQLAQITKREKRIGLMTNQVAFALYTDSLKRGQAATIRSQRLLASSDVARRVVHEASNPLSIIKNYLAVIDRKLSGGSSASEELRIIGEEIDRVTRLLDTITEFAGPETREAVPTDLNALLSDIVELSRDTILAHSSVELKRDESAPRIFIERDGLKQIILNLVTNAAEAMPEEGTLTISSRYMGSGPLTDGEPMQTERTESGYIRITVDDTGPGIPETLRLTLFEPFVTSKPGGHRGMGLAVVHSLVKSMNGSISLRSRKGKGTRFTLIFPVALA